MSDPRTTQRNAVAWIAAALLVWGGVLALGAYLAAGRHGFDPRRGLVVALAVLLFVGVWLSLIGWRLQKQRRRD